MILYQQCGLSLSPQLVFLFRDCPADRTHTKDCNIKKVLATFVYFWLPGVHTFFLTICIINAIQAVVETTT